MTYSLAVTLCSVIHKRDMGAESFTFTFAFAFTFTTILIEAVSKVRTAGYCSRLPASSTFTLDITWGLEGVGLLNSESTSSYTNTSSLSSKTSSYIHTSSLSSESSSYTKTAQFKLNCANYITLQAIYYSTT